MSVSYWGINGYGICINDIEKYLNYEKVNKLVRSLNPDVEFEDDIFEDSTFYGYPYISFADFLCELDDKKIMSYDDNGDGSSYFLYVPTYPWRRKRNEPKTEQKLEEYIIKILLKVYDATYDQLSEHIDYIDTYGRG